MLHYGISNWKSLLASHLYHSVEHIISGQLNRKTEFLLCVMCLAGASIRFYHVLPNFILCKSADLLVPSPVLGWAFAAGGISTLHCGDVFWPWTMEEKWKRSPAQQLFTGRPLQWQDATECPNWRILVTLQHPNYFGWCAKLTPKPPNRENCLLSR